jgi:hypothetical protein
MFQTMTHSKPFPFLPLRFKKRASDRNFKHPFFALYGPAVIFLRLWCYLFGAALNPFQREIARAPTRPLIDLGGLHHRCAEIGEGASGEHARGSDSTSLILENQGKVLELGSQYLPICLQSAPDIL